MRKVVIIVAGGQGLRMGSDIPKQFLLLNGKPLLMHTIEAFYYYDSEISIIVVLPEEQWLYWQQLCITYQFDILHRIAIGGQTRFHSVRNALALIEKESIVAIHDGVRPLVSRDLIAKAFRVAVDQKVVCPVIPLTDSIRIKTKKGTRGVNRNDYYRVQTPQVFRYKTLFSAYQYPYSDEFTDDVSVVESSKKCRVEIIEGDPENIKITTPIDLAAAEVLLKSKCRI
jgi:2-C-methyl-D-erythritol 4-phosphate cytidylyltransferase